MATDPQVSGQLFAKAEQLCYILIFVESAHRNSQYVESAENLLLLMVFYCWNFAPSRSKIYSELAKFVYHNSKNFYTETMKHR